MTNNTNISSIETDISSINSINDLNVHHDNIKDSIQTITSIEAPLNNISPSSKKNTSKKVHWDDKKDIEKRWGTRDKRMNNRKYAINTASYATPQQQLLHSLYSSNANILSNNYIKSMNSNSNCDNMHDDEANFVDWATFENDNYIFSFTENRSRKGVVSTLK